MATFVGTIQNGQPLLKAVATILPNDQQAKSGGFVALIDTGSQGTLVSPEVVTKLNPIPIGISGFTVANGQSVDANKYRIGIAIPIERITQSSNIINRDIVISGLNLDVLELPYRPPNYDILLGMDFLQGFHITLFGNQFILSN
jgi:predicted aspartyl protease